MRARTVAAVAVAATGAYGQTSYSTVTYDDCPTSSMESMITVTNGVTVTYCPECEMGYTTVYTTTYMSLCPTGTVPATYTVTESCSESTPTWSTGTGHIPQGFTTGVQTCTMGCAGPTTHAAVPVTITEPCGCMANEGTVMGGPTATPTAAEVSSGGTVSYGSGSATAAPGGGSGAGTSAPAATTPAGASAPAGQGALVSPPGSGSNSTGAGACPGPACQVMASSYPSGVNYGNTSNITPFTGAASSSSQSTLLAAVVAFFSVGFLALAL